LAWLDYKPRGNRLCGLGGMTALKHVMLQNAKKVLWVRKTEKK